ncbi:hypothetical protein [Kushneria phosphatilytica]|uniref:Uncharacterized protein n=1 Tax=Kushneria phosphatilytica TaxID=657387 RepID=A0A1S1NRF9_9GAMM|nr:hypothetical protein [Kushneria phosphatilytica]OHV07509.1 hypothetical protein BH688_14855 [Kushneria phosphatilytica]QEL09991.1 hypothetical protein FY550_01810 [Kushneria phosphatilytica]
MGYATIAVQQARIVQPQGTHRIMLEMNETDFGTRLFIGVDGWYSPVGQTYDSPETAYQGAIRLLQLNGASCQLILDDSDNLMTGADVAMCFARNGVEITHLEVRQA